MKYVWFGCMLSRIIGLMYRLCSDMCVWFVNWWFFGSSMYGCCGGISGLVLIVLFRLWLYISVRLKVLDVSFCMSFCWLLLCSWMFMFG